MIIIIIYLIIIIIKKEENQKLENKLKYKFKKNEKMISKIVIIN